MQDLVDGSLELHALLLEHEDAIDYEPWDSNSVSADPVVEAVPTDPKVEERMWSMIGRIALALEELTDLGETSPAHLQAALIDSIRAIH
jgi:hypothetical protein